MNEPQPLPPPEEPIVNLVPIVRRVVAARIVDPMTREDIVQETLARVMASRSRVEHESLVPYAITTARNLIASLVQGEQRARRNAHLLVHAEEPEPRPGDELLRREQATLVGTAMSRLTPAEQDILVAHEVEGTDTATLAASRGSTPGAVAAQLGRTRSRLRVEYLVAENGSEPPTDRCRPVLIALSAGDRRRQRELDVHGHLLACDSCWSTDMRPERSGRGGRVRDPVAPHARRTPQRHAARPAGPGTRTGPTDRCPGVRHRLADRRLRTVLIAAPTTRALSEGCSKRCSLSGLWHAFACPAQTRSGPAVSAVCASTVRLASPL